jgi:hypothetical protein
MRNGRGERGQCWDHHSNRRLDDHERRATRLEPNPVMEPIGQAGIIDNDGTAREVAHDGTSVRIGMVVPVTRIVMLAVRLGPVRVVLFLGTGIPAALRVRVRRNEAGNKERGKQEARHSHGSSPLPGDMDRSRARPLVIRTSR